ncbi:MAG: sugar transporter ATP-binding protein [Verrucomicrobiales bacterium]|nr:sugar transporter ATP-binding protein [Verrucomicrobiales bacterium]
MPQTVPSIEPPLLTLRGIEKSFPGVKALAGVDFTLNRREIHALMGENGAGKSTLIKVLTGVYRRDSGTMQLGGSEIDPRSPQDAQQAGISTVYQEVNLIPHLSVAENISLGRQPKRLGFLRWGEIAQRAEKAIARLDLKLDVRKPLSSCSIAVQQLIAIARALDTDARVLILDEPTSSLDTREVEQLFVLMRKLRDQGLGIVFVTHFLDQVYAVSDRITILRNGQRVGDYAAVDLSRIELISKMIGKDLSEVERESGGKAKPLSTAREILVQATGLKRKGAVENVDLTIRKGEVVGLAGLLGSGRTETARILFGIDKPDAGKIEIDGHKRELRSARQAIALGFGFSSEDRKTEGIIPNLSVRENIILVLQGQRGWLRLLSRKEQEELAAKYIAMLNIATSDAEKPIRFLSGGNQQKALLARWLASKPRLLILDEPTRGIDVGAKFEIQKLMRSLTNEGMSILFISSELEEVVRSSDRVVILRDRARIAELVGEEISQAAILSSIAGTNESSPE